VNNDQNVTPADVLDVINYIHRPLAGAGEGEGLDPREGPNPLENGRTTTPSPRYSGEREVIVGPFLGAELDAVLDDIASPIGPRAVL
jgi:hypothetical protein